MSRRVSSAASTRSSTTMTVRGRDQVMLKVTVAEVQRDVIKQLGIDLSGSLTLRQRGAQLQQRQPVHGARPAAGRGQPGHGRVQRRSTRRLRAMERAGVIRTLAEPNLTAISGESANFLAGGEFPVPGGLLVRSARPASVSSPIQFKKFGVGLNFTPVVLSEGRISLKVMTEVSELSTENAVQSVQGTPPRRPFRRSRPAAPRPRLRSRRAARSPWPA